MSEWTGTVDEPEPDYDDHDEEIYQAQMDWCPDMRKDKL